MAVTYNNSWVSAPEEIILLPSEVHIWQAPLDLPPDVIERFESFLTADEIDRAHSYRFQRHMRRYIAGRGWLRQILSRYTHIAPDQLEFWLNRYGKPFLVQMTAEQEIMFNLSHADELVLFAFTRMGAIGIDIERVRHDLDFLSIAERFFSGDEQRALMELPEAQICEAFFHCWTRKEAYIKAKGQGLSLPLDGFSVSLAPGEPGRLLVVENDPLEVQRWFLIDLLSVPNYTATLAVKGEPKRLQHWSWPDVGTASFVKSYL